jgi:hypothetical protein
MKAFISYSHRDESALERLRVHLAQLKREGSITEWHDRDILAGGPIDSEVARHLEGSALFLALASPDFLNSNYCYDKEMARAIQKQDANEMRIIPIIVQPCDWKASPLGRFKALPKDGKPISEWANANNAFLDIVGELRRIASDNEDRKPPRANPERQTSSRYRVQKKFDAIDRGDFRMKAFDAIREYFKSPQPKSTQSKGYVRDSGITPRLALALPSLIG